MKNILDKLSNIKTPFYYYNIEGLKKNLEILKRLAEKYNYTIHYALKANSNNKILNIIKDFGMGADCVSGNEILKAIEIGFPPQKIIFAGVGKTDEEINIGINNNIHCFNVESIPELEVINELAAKKKKKINIALRLNPNIDANTHEYISTGLMENKFGISLWDLKYIYTKIDSFTSINIIGLHFHIGSQITDFNVFKNLCLKVNEIQNELIQNGINLTSLNLGGGLGIDYANPEKEIEYEKYFKIFHSNLKYTKEQQVHFELGRSVIANHGELITKVLYMKNSIKKRFLIVDAGMTELLRPALYKANHKIENLTSNKQYLKYDVVGPICETSDCFGRDIELPESQRGDIIVIRTAGAYGQVMSSQYNLRTKAKTYYSDEI